SDGRSVGGGNVRQFLLPARIDQPGPLDRGDIPAGAQGDDVGFQSIDHRTRLLARSPMRLFEDHAYAGADFVVLREYSVDIRVEFPSGIIGNIEELRLLAHRRK